MTLKQEQMLGRMVGIIRGVLYYEEHFSEPARKSGIYMDTDPAWRSALKRMKAMGLVEYRQIPNSSPAVVGLIVTEAGRRWYKENSPKYDELIREGRS